MACAYNETMNSYTILLLWQALSAGSAWYIQPAGIFWFFLVLAIYLIAEYAISVYAKKSGLQAFNTPFSPAKYEQDQRLMMLQCAVTAAVTLAELIAFSYNGDWNLFWILAAGSVVFGLLIALMLKHD